MLNKEFYTEKHIIKEIILGLEVGSDELFDF